MVKLKAKLFFISTIFLFSLASLILAVFNYNPFTADKSVFYLFYTSFCLTTTGVIFFLLIFIKSRTSSGLNNVLMIPIIRISVLIGICATILLLLLGLKVLDLWVGVPIVFAILLLEFFFRTIKIKKNEN